jgi:hypothetical protein
MGIRRYNLALSWDKKSGGSILTSKNRQRRLLSLSSALSVVVTLLELLRTKTALKQPSPTCHADSI